MTEQLNRNELVELLGALGGDKDEDVLSAAREIHSKVTDAGADWNELLAPETNEPAEHAEPASVAANDEPPSGAANDEPAAASGSAQSPDDAESLKLIEQLLQKPGVSDSLREELEDYRADIAEGDFEEMDRKYLRSLFERMKGA